MEPGASRGRHGTDDVPVVTGVPVGRPSGEPESEFDVFTPIRRPDQDGPAPVQPAQPAQPRTYPDFGAAGDAYVSPYSNAPGTGAVPLGNGTPGAGDPYRDNGNYGNEATFGENGNNDGNHEEGEPAGDGDFSGLPRRVRQANLAPQLRASAAGAGSQSSAAVPPATAASLTDMRNTLSAMQRGWQQGRSQTQRDTED
jgi:hypothetical protein